MKIKLKLDEMFAISRIIDKQSVIGYRAALTKLFYEMLDINDFSKIVQIYEETKINELNILKEFEDRKNELSNKVMKYKGKKIPENVQKEINDINFEIINKINETNKDLFYEANNKLNNKTLEFEFEFNDLLVKSINNIVESEKTAKDYELEEPIIKFLIDIYIKLQKK